MEMWNDIASEHLIMTKFGSEYTSRVKFRIGKKSEFQVYIRLHCAILFVEHSWFLISERYKKEL